MLKKQLFFKGSVPKSGDAMKVRISRESLTEQLRSKWWQSSNRLFPLYKRFCHLKFPLFTKTQDFSDKASIYFVSAASVPLPQPNTSLLLLKKAWVSTSAIHPWLKLRVHWGTQWNPVMIRIKGLRHLRFLSGFVSYPGFIKYRLGSRELRQCLR